MVIVSSGHASLVKQGSGNCILSNALRISCPNEIKNRFEAQIQWLEWSGFTGCHLVRLAEGLTLQVRHRRRLCSRKIDISQIAAIRYVHELSLRPKECRRWGWSVGFFLRVKQAERPVQEGQLRCRSVECRTLQLASDAPHYFHHGVYI